jgi:cytochrome c oxidase subunit 3
VWVFIATEVLPFGGLILGYFVYRHVYPAAFAAASRHTDIVVGAANTAILLTSSFLVACAVSAVRALRTPVSLTAGALPNAPSGT